ncbi:MAG TPA: hypothetical protein VL688_12750 [Verrucomicrobiae bacterium]|nr:hypothetical protein [Verrucomicrobiae bacterium]
MKPAASSAGTLRKIFLTPIPIPPPLKRAFWAAAFVVLYIKIFFVSGSMPARAELESSWHLALEYAALHGIPHGSWILHSFGPLGYLASDSSMAVFAPARVLFAWCWTFLICTAIFEIGRLTGPRIKLLLILAAFFIFNQVNAYDHEIQPLTLVLYGVYRVLEPGASSWLKEALLAAVIGILICMKFSFFMFGTGLLAVLVLVRLAERDFGGAARLAFLFAAALAGVWMLSGQRLQDLAPWITDNMDFSAGYLSSAGMKGNPLVLRLCLAAAGLFGALLLMLAGRLRPGPRARGFLVVLAGLMVWKWKHGFVRADLHTLYFSRMMLTAASLLYLPYFYPRLEERAAKFFHHAVYVGIVGLCLAAGHLQLPYRFLPVRDNVVAPFLWKLDMFSRSVTGKKMDSFGRTECLSVEDCTLPEIRKRVGTETINAMNYDQSLLIMNALNYRPSPMVQSFDTLTPKTLARDLEFYRGPLAPRFVALHVSTLDGRLPSEDDALVLPYLFQHYVPVLRESKFLLFEKSGGPDTAWPATETLLKTRVTFRQILDLTAWNGRPLWIKARFKRSPRGKLRLWAFRAVPPQICVKSGSSAYLLYRLVPGISSEGFLLNPMLETNKDAANLIHPERWKKADKIYFEAMGGERDFEPEIEVEIDALKEGWINEAEWRRAEEVRQRRTLEKVFGPGPLQVEAARPLEEGELWDYPAVLAFPPTTIRVPVPSGMHFLEGGFGMMKESYRGGNASDGVRFIVEVEDGAGKCRRVLDRIINPHAFTAARWQSHYLVKLDPAVDKNIVLKTDPGPAGNSKADFAVWTKMKFKSDVPKRWQYLYV